MKTLDRSRCEKSDATCAYALGVLPVSEVAAAEAHIAACPDCQRELKGLRPIVDRFVSWPTDVGHLAPAIVRQVVDKFVMQLEEQLADRQVQVRLTAEARDWLAKKGYDPTYGARPLARVIQEHVKKPMADELLFGKLSRGGVVEIGLEGEKLSFTFIPSDKPPKTDDTEDKVPELVR